MNRFPLHHIIKVIIILFILVPFGLSAQIRRVSYYDRLNEEERQQFLRLAVEPFYSDLKMIGKWTSEPIQDGLRTIVIEYDFKNDSILFISYELKESIPGEGTYESTVCMDAHYKVVGPLLDISVKTPSIYVKNEKLDLVKGAKKDPTTVWETIAQKNKSTIQDILSTYATSTVPVLNKDSNSFNTFYITDYGEIRGEFHLVKLYPEEIIKTAVEKFQTNKGAPGIYSLRAQEKLTKKFFMWDPSTDEFLKLVARLI